jgi:hypothetical protein
LAQWSTLVLTLVVLIVFGGIVLGIVVPQVRNALFREAIGTLVDTVANRTVEHRSRLEAETKEIERRATMLEQRTERVRVAVDKLNSSLTRYASAVLTDTADKEELLDQLEVDISVALGVLQREGPSNIVGYVGVINAILTASDKRTYGPMFVQGQLFGINTAIRQWLESGST